MVDTARSRYPANMIQPSHFPDTSSLESFTTDALERVKQYARAEPVNFALWTFGIGFVLGWKLKPW